MRFLIDRCAGRRVADFLSAEGHDVVHVAMLGADPGDSALLSLASQERRVLVTIDNDFQALIFRDARSHHGLVRLPDVPPSERVQMMRLLLRDHSADLEAGAVITVRDGRVRISRR